MWIYFDFVIQETGGRTDSVMEYSTGRDRHGCPLNKDELGQSTWNLLHTMAAHYPDRPSDTQKEDVKSFFGILSRSYPCEICAKDFAQE